MLRTTKSRLSVVATAAALTLGAAGPASAQTTQDGLVNVNVEDVTILAPIALAANICDVNVGVLSRQERQGGATCRATAESIATPGNRPDGGGPTNQTGLVNVNLSGIDVFAPIGIAANVCDANIALLAEQMREGGAECTATAESIASRGPEGGNGPA